ncbi:MAG TPA: hypothetical protein VFQ36_09415, partial [Ktedonobacteraceae bacterium]|nr:hypothetical protein [Ktedonobacteraceae bacterium]
PGYGDMPARQEIKLVNLAQLGRGQKYRRTLTMAVAGAYGQPPTPQNFPITLRTQRFYEGLRGILWRWGLRGGFVGLGWNFAAGITLAFLLYLLIPVIIPFSYVAQPVYDVSFGSVMQSMFAGTVALLRPLDNSHILGTMFLLVVGGITGLPGFFVGYGKGHIDQTAKQGSRAFRKGAIWLSLAFFITLLILNQGWNAIVQAIQGGGDYAFVLNAFGLAGGGLIVALLGLIVALIVATIRYHVEEYLRERCEERLNLPGRA